jgi:hypothetical protein
LLSTQSNLDLQGQDIIKLAEKIYLKESFYWCTKFHKRKANDLVKMFEDSSLAWANFDELTAKFLKSQDHENFLELEEGLVKDLRAH